MLVASFAWITLILDVKFIYSGQSGLNSLKNWHLNKDFPLHPFCGA